LRLVDKLPLPIMLYNMPGCCKTWYDVESVVELSHHERILGLKDSSGDLDYFHRVTQALSENEEFAFFVGPEELLVECIDRGAHGGVNGGANMFPQLYVQMYNAAVNGERERADELKQLVLAISNTIYAASDGPSRIIKGIKSVLAELGVCDDQMAEPFTRHTAEGRKLIQQHLAELLPRLS
ncbi:MAG: dihydrodipicolinate synthase family protein, partial [Planctomycetales bacterium]|nr:dihydrodipicolinate synthase family protein [Planctomycetales bacterium]